MATKHCIGKASIALICIIAACFYASNIDLTTLLRRRLLKSESIKLFLWPKEPTRYELFNYTVISFLEENTHNGAKRGRKECTKPISMKYLTTTKNCITAINCQTVLITHMIDIDDGKHSTNFSGYRAPSKEEIRAYYMNMYYIIQQNLNHPKLKAVVILCESVEMAAKLYRVDFENSNKLSIQNINNTITMGRQIEYGSRCFRDEIVVVANQDIVLGNGWERLNLNYMKENKVMYALTRHASLRNCLATVIKSNCIKHRRMGSYDAFVWHVKEHIKESIFTEKLGDSKPSTKGMENVVVWIFKNLLNYEVTNPCKILQIHHEHCIPIRDSQRGERVNKNGNSAKADVSVKLKQN